MSHRRLHILIALLCTGLWAGAIWLGHSSGHLRFLDRLESALTDVRTLLRGVKTPPDLVTIVAIDDTIVKLVGTYPLPRAEIAKIVEAIARLEPKVIAIDLLLIDKGPTDGDAALAKSLAARPTVLAAAAVFSNTVQPSAENDGPLARLPKANRFLLPLPAFADRAEVGIANVATGQTGTPLLVPMLFRTRDKIELSFPLRVASIAIEQPLTIEPERLRFGDRPIATASDYALPISYYGPRQTIRTISAANLVDGQVDKEAIQGRIVVLGATATGAGDFFPTPFDSLMPGVEIISTAVTHLIAGDGLVRDQTVRIAEAITTILLPVLLVGLLAWRRNPIGLVAVSAVVLTWATANAIAFAHGIWLHSATTIAAATPPLMLFGAVQLWSGRRNAQHLAVQNRLLEQFQTPGLQQWLMRDPDFLLAPVRQNAAVVFVDLSGFTSLSETLDPDATRGLLKEFHALVDKEATRCGGMITSFLGDGAMILFGLPEPAADDATRAAQCSIALCVKTERWIEALPSAIAHRIGFKIGAHFGPIVASRLGGRNHQHITATGDTVNVASRLMEVAARHDVRLALSDTLRIAAERTGARLKTGSLAGPVEAQIRGRSGSLTVWLWRSERPTLDQRTRPDAAE
ncbi:CHASE2 domain-containing protein [Bradyrhizobium australiense]|uniref:Adenylate/guanylate cyclase domain-containing protein n=1 Tax=Bradyrhizobium australiense TaxID=2721161 RepID=A0A7Y4GN94_9BRAD|nr:adenylate/guanylate cyclase domain-containing protein [Bradyrhizobium australiense]NOJ38913.1 adenylate/guanylate cyclase domain-containing protein [Bradyrhizobium australiense]